MTGSENGAMTREEIEAVIPHRPPFLWLDEVAERGEQRIVASKTLEPDLPVFGGHYPQFPLLPGVLQCEMCFQASAVLIAFIEPAEGHIPVVSRANNIKFRRMVRPGETIEVAVEITDRVGPAFYLKGKTTVDGKTTCTLDFTTTATDPPA